MAARMRAQTSIAVKVCGLTKTDQAKEIAALGVDAIGVIGVEQSPRYVSESQRRNIFSPANFH